jgi:hypothetical protein
VQVRGLLTREELDRYNALMEVGAFLESQSRYDLSAIIQSEVDRLILPAIERLKAKSRERDRLSQQFLEEQRRLEWEARMREMDNENDD